MDTGGRERLFAALDQARPDPNGQRWATAEMVGRDFVAVLDVDGRLVVEARWQHRGRRERQQLRLEQLPCHLQWRSVVAWRALEQVEENTHA